MIVHVLGRMSAGGNERLCLELIRRAPIGLEQVLLTIDPSPSGPLEELFHAIPGLQFEHVPYVRTQRVRFVIELARRFRALPAEGVVAYPFGLHLLVALAAKAQPGCRVIAHVGNPPAVAGAKRAMFRRIIMASRWLGTPLWCCSETVRDQMDRLAGPLPLGSCAMPNGINIKALREASGTAVTNRLRRTQAGPVVAMVARLDGIKDHHTLLSAFAQVVKERPDAKLWLVGDGILRQALEREVVALKLTNVVEFLGVRTDIGQLLAEVDIFVFSTTGAEGFGIALAEAMALGLPVVATDVPACREVLGDGSCGILVRPNDPAAIRRAILDLLDNPAYALSLGAKAALRAETRYDIAHCAAEYYRQLLD
jgi:glycosyltransferase involved in cell wall biosynthesis